MYPARLTILLSLTLALGAAGDPSRMAIAVPRRAGEAARRITFEQRVEAQRAIERVYYAGRVGATRAFDVAVPRQALERKVRTYLAQSVALERLWKSPIGAAALRRELERIASSTLF